MTVWIFVGKKEIKKSEWWSFLWLKVRCTLDLSVHELKFKVAKQRQGQVGLGLRAICTLFGP